MSNEELLQEWKERRMALLTNPPPWPFRELELAIKRCEKNINKLKGINPND